MHGSKKDDGSLVFGLIDESQTHFVDRVVISMVGRGFKPEGNDPGLLKTSTKKKIINNFRKRWEKKVKHTSQLLTPATLLSKQAERLVNLFKYDGKYTSYRMRW